MLQAQSNKIMTNNEIILPYSEAIYSLRDPKGKDLRSLASMVKDKNEVESVYVLITHLAEPKLTMEDLDMMDAEDVTTLMTAIKSLRAFSRKV